MRSIEQRIRSGLILSLLVAFTVLALLADYGVKHLSRDFVTTRLQHDSDNLIKALALSVEADWQLNSQRVPLIYQRVKSGHYFQVLSDAQLIRSRSLWDSTPPIRAVKTGSQTTTLEPHGDEHWLVWQQGVTLQGRPVTLWLAEDMAPLEHQWRQFSLILYATMAIALAMLVLLQRVLLRRSFSELNSLRQAIQLLQQGEIEALSASVPTEIQPLTAEINHLLQRLEQRISRSRTAMGNLAHELKRVLQRLHLLRDALPPSLQTECDEALAQIRHLTDRELKRARIAGSPHPGRRFTPKQDLPHLAELLQRIYPDMRLEMQFEDSIELPFDRDDMLELIGNLLDNACKFGSTKAALSLTLSEGQLALEILNDGAQIAESSRTRILERGVRIDESIAGHGLGLSICNMIVDSYNGELEIRSATSEGGYSVSVMVRLPLR